MLLIINNALHNGIKCGFISLIRQYNLLSLQSLTQYTQAACKPIHALFTGRIKKHTVLKGHTSLDGAAFTIAIRSQQASHAL